MTFPIASRKEPAYDVSQVDAFLATARNAYDTYNASQPQMTAADVRRAAFDLAKQGYSAAAVDAGLERLESALAELEREQIVMTQGWEGLSQRSRDDLENVRAQLSRPTGKRFNRSGAFKTGYRITDVDAFVDEALAGLDGSATLRASWVRQALFRAQKGGYNENDVDATLDNLIAALLAAGQA